MTPSPDALHPQWATCDRAGCTEAATHGYNTALFAVKVCEKHLHEERLPDGIEVEAMGDRWWESVPEELQ